MNRQELVEWIGDAYGVQPDYPWQRYPEYAVFRHEDGKWFALLMPVPAEKFGVSTQDVYHVINVKVLPEKAAALRGTADVFPAYHMNKEHWVSVRIDGGLETDWIKMMVDDSHYLTR